ncbi:hypothetical protein CA13_49000 [Planctomycetes bacterium CA13]|uniref:Secreted protein n=1 Tax=Novipirellula herctigrandis TaxID=2527986 RepID=A0A5C5Z861_9BACT|nr:hypothetical protein CA13_49000 [Planctomycetes bacterium CA13]
MKIDRYKQNNLSSESQFGFTPMCFTGQRQHRVLIPLVLAAFFANLAFADTPSPTAQSQIAARETDPNTSEKKFENEQPRTHAAAKKLLRRVIFGLASGPAFESKVRERVWSTGREVVGVGTYEQSGNQTGQFHLQMTMHDGDGKHTLQQISDGRLAWTRTEIADQVSLKRVDVSRLDEWSSGTMPADQLPLRLRVGGWIEMLESIDREHFLHVDSATMQGQSVWVITAVMSKEQRERLMQSSNRSQWPALYPVKVRIAISKTGSDETGFGKFLPVRFEFWSLPEANTADAKSEPNAVNTNAISKARLITLIELYAIRQITAPPIARFRFENRDAEVNFINETTRYMKQFGIDVASKPDANAMW